MHKRVCAIFKREVAERLLLVSVIKDAEVFVLNVKYIGCVQSKDLESKALEAILDASDDRYRQEFVISKNPIRAS